MHGGCQGMRMLHSSQTSASVSVNVKYSVASVCCSEVPVFRKRQLLGYELFSSSKGLFAGIKAG